MTFALSATADRIAAKAAVRHFADDWDSLRDLCDIATQGELDATQLDLLTSAVQTRIKQDHAQTLRYEPCTGYRVPVVRVFNGPTIRDCLYSLSFDAEGQPINPPAAATPEILGAAWLAWTIQQQR